MNGDGANGDEAHCGGLNGDGAHHGGRADGEGVNGGGTPSDVADGAGTPTSATPVEHERPGVGKKQKTRPTVSNALAKRMMDTSALDERSSQRFAAILLTMKLFNVLNTFLWEAKALSIMMVGVGVKMAMNNPTVSASEHYAPALRMQLGLPLATCFFVQMFHHTYVKTRHTYSKRAICEQPMHFVVVGLRATVLGLCAGVCFLPLKITTLLIILAALAIINCVLMYEVNHRFALRGGGQHPMSELPTALLNMQQRRKKAQGDNPDSHGHGHDHSGVTV